MRPGESITRRLLGSLAIFFTVLSFLPDFFLLRAGQPGQAASHTIISPASRLSEPAFFDIAGGESLKVVAQGPTSFSYDVFVYDAATHDLWAAQTMTRQHLISNGPHRQREDTRLYCAT